MTNDLYKTLDAFFIKSDDLIDFENKSVADIIKQVVSYTLKARTYHSLVKRDVDLLLIDIENMYGKKFKSLIEQSKRALDTKSLQYYINCDDDVVKMRKLYEKYNYYLNRLTAIIESLDKFSWQINNLTKLLIEKMDSFTI